jgi:hypothetical protein
MTKAWDPKTLVTLTALFVACAVIAPKPALAVSVLTATATGSAAALCNTGEPTQSIIPGDGSVTVLFGAAASGNCGGNQASASALGAAEARFGALAGHARADASMAFLTPTFVGAAALLLPRFVDTVEVVSNTLAADTPVTLTFIMTLDAIAFHGFDAPALDPPSRVGASASSFALISDIEALTRTTFFGPIVDSSGTNVTQETFEVDTAVGHHLELDVSLSIAAQIGLQCFGFPDHCATTATAEVIADQTAHFFYQSSGDVRLVSESGHDYAVPGSVPRPVAEPTSLMLLGVGGAGIVAATFRRSRTSNLRSTTQ